MLSPDSRMCAPDEAIAALARGDLIQAGPWVGHIDDCVDCRRRFETLIEAADLTRPDDARDGHSQTFGTCGNEIGRLLGGVRAEVLRRLRPPEEPDELGRLGPYRVFEILGAGGMGIVLRAEETPLGRQVALKIMREHLDADPVARERFYREARALAVIEHDHVVPIYRVGEDNGTPFVTMPLLGGEELAAALLRKGRLPAGQVVEIGRQTALGLAAAHERGLVHRDVKPSNIWLEPRPDGTTRVRLLDFGLVTSVAGVETSASAAMIGTPAYMSPEQVRSRVTDHRTDLFSLGVVMYRLVTGELPFPGEDAYEVGRKIVESTPKHPAVLTSECPRPLSALIMRMMSKLPEKRPPTAKSVADELMNLGSCLPKSSAGKKHWKPLVRLVAVGLVLVGVSTLIRTVWRLSHLDHIILTASPDAPAQQPMIRLLSQTGPDETLRRVYALALTGTSTSPGLLSECFPDGKGEGVRVWTEDLKPAGTIPSRGEYLRSLVTTPDGGRFLTVGGGGLELWRLSDGSTRRIIPPTHPPAPIGGIAVDPRGERIYTTDYDEGGRLRPYLLTDRTLTALKPFDEPIGLPWRHAVSANGRWVAATSKAGKVCLWDTADSRGPKAHVLRTDGTPFPVVAFASDGRRAWVVDGSPTTDAYDLSGTDPRLEKSWITTANPKAAPVIATYVIAEDSWLLIVGQRGIRVISTTGHPDARNDAHEPDSPMRSSAWLPAKGRLFTGHDNGIRSWEISLK